MTHKTITAETLTVAQTRGLFLEACAETFWRSIIACQIVLGERPSLWLAPEEQEGAMRRMSVAAARAYVAQQVTARQQVADLA